MFAKNSYLCMKRAVTDGLHTDKRIIHTFMEVINLGNSNKIVNKADFSEVHALLLLSLQQVLLKVFSMV